MTFNPSDVNIEGITPSGKSFIDVFTEGLRELARSRQDELYPGVIKSINSDGTVNVSVKGTTVPRLPVNGLAKLGGDVLVTAQNMLVLSNLPNKVIKASKLPVTKPRHVFASQRDIPFERTHSVSITQGEYFFDFFPTAAGDGVLTAYMTINGKLLAALINYDFPDAVFDPYPHRALENFLNYNHDLPLPLMANPPDAVDIPLGTKTVFGFPTGEVGTHTLIIGDPLLVSSGVLDAFVIGSQLPSNVNPIGSGEGAGVSPNGLSLVTGTPSFVPAPYLPSPESGSLFHRIDITPYVSVGQENCGVFQITTIHNTSHFDITFDFRIVRKVNGTEVTILSDNDTMFYNSGTPSETKIAYFREFCFTGTTVNKDPSDW